MKFFLYITFVYICVCSSHSCCYDIHVRILLFFRCCIHSPLNTIFVVLRAHSVETSTSFLFFLLSMLHPERQLERFLMHDLNIIFIIFLLLRTVHIQSSFFQFSFVDLMPPAFLPLLTQDTRLHTKSIIMNIVYVIKIQIIKSQFSAQFHSL